MCTPFVEAGGSTFDGGRITSDGGALLLRETDRRLNLLPRLAACFDDSRNPWFTRYSVEELLGQRICGLALGYEDLNDHDQLRNDPLLGVLAGKREAGEEPLAGKSTLNRLELSTEKPDRYKKISYQQEKIDELLVRLSIEDHSEPPECVVLDLDVTDLPLHGHQEGRFFTGITTAIVTCRCAYSGVSTCCARVCERRIRMDRRAAGPKWSGSSANCDKCGPVFRASCGPTADFAGRN